MSIRKTPHYRIFSTMKDTRRYVGGGLDVVALPPLRQFTGSMKKPDLAFIEGDRTTAFEREPRISVFESDIVGLNV